MLELDASSEVSWFLCSSAQTEGEIPKVVNFVCCGCCMSEVSAPTAALKLEERHVINRTSTMKGDKQASKYERSCLPHEQDRLQYKYTYVTIVSTLPTGLDANDTQPSTTPCLAASEETLSPPR